MAGLFAFFVATPSAVAGNYTVCRNSDTGHVYEGLSDDCDVPVETPIHSMTFEPDTGLTLGNVQLNTGVNGLSTFGDNVNFNGLIQANQASINQATFGGSLSAASGATVNMNSNRIQNVGAPTAGTDAATKDYVDSLAGAGSTKDTEQDGRLNGVEAKNVEQDGRLNVVETKNVEQDGRLNVVETKNVEQDGRLNVVETRNVEQDGRLNTVETKNVEQDGRLDGHDTMLAAHQATLDTHTLQIADLDTRVTTNTQDIANLDGRVTGLETSLEGGFARLDERIDKAFEGAAMAMAMAAPAMPSDKNYAVSINWGGFEGKNAFAGTAQARISESFMIHGGIGVGSAGTVGGRAGLTYAW